MNVGYKSLLVNSFYLWLDDYILSKGQAYKNITSSFYQQAQDRRFTSLSIYNCPYKQLVYNYNVDGAIIPSGISGSNGFIARGTSGCKIDFNEGRVLFSGGITSNFSGSYAVKDFNIYVANDTEENIVFSTAYKYNKSFGASYSGNEPYTKYLPGIFINLPKGINEPFAFGGMDKSSYTVRLTCINDNYSKMVDLLSLLEDSTRTCFPLLYENDIPLNVYGDYKSGLYNYGTVRDAAVANNNNLVFIDRVSTSVLSNNSLRAPNELISFAEFELCSYRYPRQYYS